MPLIIYNNKEIPPKVKKILLACAKKAEGSMMKSKHCACIEKGGQIYAFAINDYTGVRCSRINKFSYHAEEHLLKHATKKKGRTKYNLYIVRINQRGELINSKPCKACAKIIRNHSTFISKVFYPIDNGKIEVERPLNVKSTHLSLGNKIRIGQVL